MAKKHILLKAAACSAAVVGGVSIAFNQLVLTRASRTISDKADAIRAKKNPQTEKPQKDILREQSTEWYNNQNLKNVTSVNFQNKIIHAVIIDAPEKTDKWVIISHGFTSDPAGMTDYAQAFHKMGYNILLPVLRGHGISEEKYITMGWFDRLDILDWIKYIINIDADAQIVLHGVSMGGATVMMTTGESLPDNVKCAVEDCGYSSVWDEYSNELRKTYHLPVFPLLYVTSSITKVICGYGFKEASSIEQVKKSKTPTLFIHGEKDEFVPYRMLDLNYNAAGCVKEKLSIPDAEHAESCRVHPEIYWPEVEKFIKKYVK